MNGYYALLIYPNIFTFMRVEMPYFVETDGYWQYCDFNGEKLKAACFLLYITYSIIYPIYIFKYDLYNHKILREHIYQWL